MRRALFRSAMSAVLLVLLFAGQVPAQENPGRFIRIDLVSNVDIFDNEGNLILRLEHEPWMNAPRGMALAPVGFGKLGDHLLVGNAGSGRISVFDPAAGAYEGDLQDVSGSTLTIPGLRGMGFGNGGIAGLETDLYFTAGDKDRGQNVFGAIVSSALPPHSALAIEFALSP